MKILGRHVVCPFMFRRKKEGWSILGRGDASVRFGLSEYRFYINHSGGSAKATRYVLQKIKYNVEAEPIHYSEWIFVWRPDVTRYWWVVDGMKKG